MRAVEVVKAFQTSTPLLEDESAAKLVFIDQFGVDEVTDEVFRKLVAAPACDFLFFLTSSTLHRFRDHPAIKQKIVRPDDYYHVHRKVLEYYQELLPDPASYYLAPFSIKTRIKYIRCDLQFEASARDGQISRSRLEAG